MNHKKTGKTDDKVKSLLAIAGFVGLFLFLLVLLVKLV